MRAFFKTLFGDNWNMTGVALIVATAAGLTAAGHGGWTVFAVPPVTLGVVAWLARH